MKLELQGAEELESTLSALSDVDWAGLKKMQGADMLNRGHQITPVKSGDLRKSSFFDGVDTYGYGMEYAPHVEYGHRIVRGGVQVGYVEGQHFLEQNVKAQEPIFFKDVNDWIAEKMK